MARNSFLANIVALLVVSCVSQYVGHAQPQWGQVPRPSYGAPSIVVSDDVRGIVYCGLASGGLYRSLDSARSWQPINGGLPRLAVRGLHVAASGHLYVGTSGSGIWRSTDFGEHWLDANAGILDGDRLNEVKAFANDRAGNVHAGINRQPYRYDDSTGSWVPIVRRIPSYAITAMTFDTAGACYVGVLGGGVLRALPDGYWETIDSGLSGDLSVLSLVAGADGSLYVNIATGLYRLDIGTRHWEPIMTGLGLPQPSIVAVNVLGSSGLVVGTSNGVFRSFDDGNHWTRISASTPFRVLDVAFDTMMVSDILLVCRANFVDTVWRATSTGMQGITITRLITSSTNSLLAQVYGSWYTLTQDGRTWDTLLSDDGSPIVGQIIPKRDGRWLSFFGDSLRYRSDDGGASWTRAGGGSANGLWFIGELADGSLLKLQATSGPYRFHRSTDAGNSWTPVGQDTADPPPQTCFVVDMSCFVTGGGGSINRYVFTGDTMRRDASQVLPFATKTLASANHGIVFAGGWGEGLGVRCGLYRSNDTGHTWSRASNGLLDTNIRALLVVGDTLYIGTNAGIFFGSVTADTWMRADEGVVGTTIRALARGSDGYLYAGTEERGLFKSTSPVASVSTAVRHSIPRQWLSAVADAGGEMLTVRVSTEQMCSGSVRVYAIDGRLFEMIYSGEFSAGPNNFAWRTSRHLHGCYFLRLDIGGHSESLPVLVP